MAAWLVVQCTDTVSMSRMVWRDGETAIVLAYVITVCVCRWGHVAFSILCVGEVTLHGIYDAAESNDPVCLCESAGARV
eukprot:4408116-Prymnesium_polylepis.1